jgi:hypothetical protein
MMGVITMGAGNMMIVGITMQSAAANNGSTTMRPKSVDKRSGRLMIQTRTSNKGSDAGKPLSSPHYG